MHVTRLIWRNKEGIYANIMGQHLRDCKQNMVSGVLAHKARTFHYFTPIIKRKKHTDKGFLIFNSVKHCYLFYFLVFKFIDSREREREEKEEEERDKHQPVVLPIHVFIGWLLHMPWPGIESTTLAHGEDAPTNWATSQGKTLLINRISSTLALAPSQLFDQQLISQSQWSWSSC